MPRRLAVKLIRFYQATLSPDHGPFRTLYPHGVCRHEPTCSMYAIEVISKHGIVMGGLRATARVLSCNPFVPPSKKKIMKVCGMPLQENQS